MRDRVRKRETLRHILSKRQKGEDQSERQRRGNMEERETQRGEKERKRKRAYYSWQTLSWS